MDESDIKGKLVYLIEFSVILEILASANYASFCSDSHLIDMMQSLVYIL